MTQFHDGVSLQDENLTSDDRLHALFDRTRTFVDGLTSDGASFDEISFILAYISMEIGLHFTENSYDIILTSLSGITNAITNAVNNENVDAEQNALTQDAMIQLQDAKVH